MSVQMLPAGQEEPDVQVSWVDQQRINSFSKLNARLSDLESIEESKKLEMEYMEDVGTEIELLDEDELVQLKIGDTFYWLKQAEVVEKLEKGIETTQTELDNVTEKISSIKEQMDTLKQELYGKFGSSINLER